MLKFVAVFVLLFSLLAGSFYWWKIEHPDPSKSENVLNRWQRLEADMLGDQGVFRLRRAGKLLRIDIHGRGSVEFLDLEPGEPGGPAFHVVMELREEQGLVQIRRSRPQGTDVVLITDTGQQIELPQGPLFSTNGLILFVLKTGTEGRRKIEIWERDNDGWLIRFETEPRDWTPQRLDRWPSDRSLVVHGDEADPSDKSRCREYSLDWKNEKWIMTRGPWCQPPPDSGDGIDASEQ